MKIHHLPLVRIALTGLVLIREWKGGDVAGLLALLVIVTIVVNVAENMRGVSDGR